MARRGIPQVRAVARLYPPDRRNPTVLAIVRLEERIERPYGWELSVVRAGDYPGAPEQINQRASYLPEEEQEAWEEYYRLIEEGRQVGRWQHGRKYIEAPFIAPEDD
jgi:hypothetical protein